MHSYMHSSKITKQKKIKFHSFIYAFLKYNKTKKIKFYAFINAFFFKKNNIKKAKITHAFKHAFSFKKFIKFHAFINAFFKKKITKSKRQKEFMHSRMHFHSKKIHKVLSIHKCTPQNKRKSNFMHSNMHYHSNQKFIFNQTFLHS